MACWWAAEAVILARCWLAGALEWTMAQAFDHLCQQLGLGFLVQNLAGRQFGAGLEYVFQHHAGANAAVFLLVIFRLQQNADGLVRV